MAVMVWEHARAKGRLEDDAVEAEGPFAGFLCCIPSVASRSNEPLVVGPTVAVTLVPPHLVRQVH